MSTTDVSLDGWPLIGNTPAGGRAKLTGMTGWLAKSLRRERSPRAGADGDWASAGSVEGKTITLEGQIVYGNAQTAAVERRQMLAIGGRGTTELTVVDAGGQLTAFVEVDALAVTPVRDTMVTFTITAHACDPVLYGPPTFDQTGLTGSNAGTGLTFPLSFPLNFGVPAGQTPGSIALVNDGTEDYWPRLRIDGPVPNPVITVNETGDWIRYGGTIAAGQWLDIDCGLRRVLLNGSLSVLSRVTYSGRWLGIPPGGASVSVTADAADPAASLSIFAVTGAYL